MARSSTRGTGWAPSGWASPWECRAAQSRQARPQEVQEPSWGTAKGWHLDPAVVLLMAPMVVALVTWIMVDDGGSRWIMVVDHGGGPWWIK